MSHALLVPLVGCSSAAFGNVPLPTVFAMKLPLAMGLSVFAATLVLVTLLEAVVLTRLYRQNWRSALRLCSVANILSTAIGALLGTMIGIFVVGVVVTHLANTRWSWSGPRRLILVVAVVAAMLAVMVPWRTIPAVVLQVYVTFLFAFALTILLESFIFARPARSPKAGLKWALGVNAVSYLVIVAVLFMINFRSGAFAVRDWFLYRVASSGQLGMTPGQVISHIEEFYAWEASGAGMKVLPRQGAPEPYWELKLVRRWAEEGDRQHARELLDLVHAKYSNAADNWGYKPAVEALSQGTQ